MSGEPNVASMALAENLSSGIKALGLSLDAPRMRLLLEYLLLLMKWNAVYNLTAIREPERMVTHHLLDSLAVLPHVHGPRLLDIGSGAGLPGMVLAIARSDLHCTLLDSRQKKTRFLTQAVIELGLKNVEVVKARAEDYHPASGFDTVIARAVSDVAALLAIGRPLLSIGGRLLAMLGKAPTGDELRLERAVVTLRELVVPGLNADRHLAIVEVVK